MLRRRCQVFFQDKGVSEFRRPAIRYRSVYDLGDRGFFLKGYMSYRFLFRLIVYGRHLWYFTNVVIRHGLR